MGVRARRSMVIVVMGVAGAGKTTIGKQLAQRLQFEFLDADAFHPPANVAKMAVGTPLDDDDRKSWLEALHRALAARAARRENVVLACSALKDRYRRTLERGIAIRWIYLEVSPATARSRLRRRAGHFAKETLVESQFATLEKPEQALLVDGEKPPAQIVAEIAASVRDGG